MFQGNEIIYYSVGLLVLDAGLVGFLTWLIIKNWKTKKAMLKSLEKTIEAAELTKDRLDAWRLILEALSMGCSIPRAKELSEKWGLTFEDSIEMLKRYPREDVTPAIARGMDIFIGQILGMDIERYWDKTREEWDGKMDKAGDQNKTEKID